MRLTHIRVRTLMVLVGVVALLIWGAMMGSRSKSYHDRANEFSFQEQHWRENAVRGRFNPKITAECVEYFADLTRKYRRATWRPWMPVAPDPHAPGYDQYVEQERRAAESSVKPADSDVRSTRDR